MQKMFRRVKGEFKDCIPNFHYYTRDEKILIPFVSLLLHNAANFALFIKIPLVKLIWSRLVFSKDKNKLVHLKVTVSRFSPIHKANTSQIIVCPLPLTDKHNHW